MATNDTITALQLRSLVRASGELELSLVEVPIPAPGADEVLVRIEASPINPSDLGLLIGPADMTSATYSGTAARPVVTARIPTAAMGFFAGRLEQSTPVGNEGAGLVVAAGSSGPAQALIGKNVALVGGAMYSQYRCMKVEQCAPLPADVTPAEGASCFVNPLTALGMVETMKREGHKALVHTAAASNLGQMLNKVCLEDGVALVNIVRKPEQEQLLRDLGATHVYNSESPTFIKDLIDALDATGATIAFDAIGGGKLAGQILSCMEVALSRHLTVRGVYGSPTHKQVYIYGRLRSGATELPLDFGMAWGVGGWLLFPFLNKVGPERALALRTRVMAGLKTTFASHYSRTVSLAEVLQPEAISVYATRATGAKFLINPNKDISSS